MTGSRPRLAFVSTVFLFPNDAGGKIRSTNILRGLKDASFDVTLMSPASETQRRQWVQGLDGVCDRFVAWQPPRPRPKWQRSLDLLGDMPVNVAFDCTATARKAVQQTLSDGHFDVVVFDFVHSAALRPQRLDAATVCFTHNAEAEIFARHAANPSHNSLMRWVWAAQRDKMARFEAQVLPQFDHVVAVSERDQLYFREHYGVQASTAIPTTVDLDYFSWRAPPGPDAAPTVIFTGSMDWAANVDGVAFFLREVWPKVLERRADARFLIVGKNPTSSLVALARGSTGVEVTGFVDDVRPYGHWAHVFVVPLRVGGGTRIKAFEAMAMGCPVVSTTIGIEGLPVNPDQHFLLADSAEELAGAVASLLEDQDRRMSLSVAARELVENHFGHHVSAEIFERACHQAIDDYRSRLDSGRAAARHPEETA